MKDSALNSLQKNGANGVKEYTNIFSEDTLMNCFLRGEALGFESLSNNSITCFSLARRAFYLFSVFLMTEWGILEWKKRDGTIC